MTDKHSFTIGNASLLSSARSRRDILKLMAMGGALVLLPTALAGCSDDKDAPTGPGTGDPLTIDFAKGDIAVLQFAYALEQLEADFYTKVLAAFGSSNLTAAEKAVLTDIKYHEVLHRELFKAALGSTNGFTINTTYPGVNFSDRLSVLNAAKTFEDLGVAAYNGAGQYITSPDYLTLAGKIVSVEARHASTIRDLLNPGTSDFAPTAFDDVFRPSKVAAAAQGYIIDTLGFANAPSAFAQGPNNNG